MHIFSFIITTYLKKFIYWKSTYLTRYRLTCSLLQTFGRNPTVWGRRGERGEENHVQQQKKFSFLESEKSFSSNSNFYVITQYNLYLKFSSLFLHLFFWTSGFMCTYIILILVSWWLLNLICNMTKALNGQNSTKLNFNPPSFLLSMLFGKPCFNYCLFPFYSLLFSVQTF